MTLLTRRFPTILGLLLLVGGLAALWWYIGRNQTQVAADIVPAKVKITNVADQKFTVSWTTSSPAIGFLEYGATGGKLTTKAADDRDLGTFQGQYVTHHVTVESLQPGTQYAFRILSGGANNRFDNNGSPYSVSTGPTIAKTPVAQSFYGKVEGVGGKVPEGTIVYLALPGAAPVSALTTTTGSYAFSLSTVRTTDLTKYIEYDPSATIANVEVESGGQQSLITVTTANSEPVPTITLGRNADYTKAEQPPVAAVEPNAVPEETTLPEAAPVGETPTIFNVEPLTDGGNRTSTAGEVKLLNPEEEGEQVATTRPEFRGVGPKSVVLSITVHSTQQFADTVVVAGDGTWSWTPPSDLSPGAHTVTIAYIDTAGIEQVMERTFVVAAVTGDPAFVSTPSATLKSPSPLPSTLLTYSPAPSSDTSESGNIAASPREGMPSTESGVPVTGVASYTLLTGAVGFVIMIVGALLLAL